MDSRQRRIVLVTVVCSLAISLTAATLDSTVETSVGGAGGGGAAVPSDASERGSSGEGVGFAGPPCVSWLATPWSALGLLGVLGGTSALLRQRYGRFEAVAFAVGVGIPALGLYLLLTACTFDEARPPVFDLASRSPMGRPLEGAGSGSPTVIPPALLGAFLVAGLLLAAVLLYVPLFGRDDSSAPANDGGEHADGVAAVRAAGETAEHIESGGDLEDEVLRAWRNMAGHLNLTRPETSTPGEFAEAAIERGLRPDAVRELTALFEEVRYGGFETTSEREARARRALRAIEGSYETARPDDKDTDEEGATDV